MTRWLYWTLCVAACSTPTRGDGTDGGGTQPDANVVGTGTSLNGELKILSLTTTAPKITGGKPMATETSSVTFVAIVTDTKGLGTIAGGQLVDSTGATYTAFQAGASMGTYTATISFEQINQIRAIDFPMGGGSMSLTAKFFDNDANTATASVSVELACRDDVAGLEGACAGVCSDTSIDPANCGTCGNACEKGLQCTGACTPVTFPGTNLVSSCVQWDAVAVGTTCTDICSAVSHSCSAGTGMWIYTASTTCTGTHESDLGCTTATANPAPNQSFDCNCD